jgi:hypothetical protein
MSRGRLGPRRLRQGLSPTVRNEDDSWTTERLTEACPVGLLAVLAEVSCQLSVAADSGRLLYIAGEHLKNLTEQQPQASKQ